MNVGSLPDVIILEIFRHLPFVDLCKAAQVCSRWRRVSRDKSLRKVVDVHDNNKLSWNHIHMLIKYHCTEALVDLSVALNDEPLVPQRRVTTCRFSYNCERCLTVLNTCSPNLKYLSLDRSIVRLNLYDCIKYLPKSVTHFSLRFNKFHGIFDEYTADMKKPNVEFLAVSHCTFLTVMYVDFLDCFPKLRELHMDQVNFDDYNILRCPLFSRNLGKRLRILNLEGNSGYDDFYVAFDNCVALEEMYLGHNLHAIDDEMLQDGPDLPNLHTLCVVNTNVKLGKDSYMKKFPKLKHYFCGEREELCSH